MAEEDKELSKSGLSETEFSDLLQSVSAMAPLMKGLFQKAPSPPVDKEAAGGRHAGCARREALLLALKPYLSPARREAVDYFIRLARVGDAIRALQ